MKKRAIETTSNFLGERGLLRKEFVIPIVLLLSFASAIVWAKIEQRNIEAQAQSLKENIQYLLPPLIRQEQQVSSLEEKKRFTYKVRSVIDGLNIASRYVRVVIQNELIDEDLDNLNEKPELRETIKQNISPIPVEYIVPNNRGQATAVASIYIDPVEGQIISLQFVGYLFLSCCFWGIIATALSYIYLQNENKYLRLKSENYKLTALYDLVDETVQSELSQGIGNELQVLQAYFERVDAEIDDMLHDAYRAPMLTIDKEDRNKHHTNLVEKIESVLSSNQYESICKSITHFIQDTSLTVDTLQFTLEEMREFAKTSGKIIDVDHTIQELLDKLPPAIRTKSYLKPPRLTSKHSKALYICCNPYHLKKIIKNAIYNSAASISNIYKKDRSYIGKVELATKIERGHVIIEITDNGQGYPEEILQSLYQSDQRINQQNGRGQGSRIVKTLLTHNSGKVKLSNTLDGGACCQFIFPVAD